MHVDAFDRLTRRVSAVGTRRSALGVLLGATLATLPARESAAKCKTLGQFCKKPKNCCSKICNVKKGDKEGKCECKRLGQECESSDNCCEIPTMRCSREGRKAICCVAIGDPCRSSRDCCKRLQCDGGICSN
jgi:hypothetical protein